MLASVRFHILPRFIGFSFEFRGDINVFGETTVTGLSHLAVSPFCGCTLYLALGQGLGTKALRQIRDTVLHDTERVKVLYRVGKHPNTTYRAFIEISIYCTEPFRSTDMRNIVYQHDTEEMIYRIVCSFLKKRSREHPWVFFQLTNQKVDRPCLYDELNFAERGIFF